MVNTNKYKIINELRRKYFYKRDFYIIGIEKVKKNSRIEDITNLII